MTNYNFGQLESIWIEGGGSIQMAPMMAAIALAESNGNPTALNPNDTNGQGGTQSSYGLWQISNGTHSAPRPEIGTLVEPLEALAPLW